MSRIEKKPESIALTAPERPRGGIVTDQFELTPRNLETAVAVLRERIDNLFRSIHERFDTLRIQTTEFESELKHRIDSLDSRMKSLEKREGERNDSIRKLTIRADKSDDWHETTAAEALKRLNKLDSERRDGEVRKSVWASQARMITTGIGIGAGVVSAFVYLTGI